MLSAKLLLGEIATSLRQVIGPAIADPYPKSQAYMAATILDFVSRQIEDRSDNDDRKAAIINALFDDLPALGFIDVGIPRNLRGEAAVSRLIERLYEARTEIGDATFEAVNQRVRRTLRSLLDLELEIAGKGD